MALHGVYYWMLNIQIKQLPPWAKQGLLAILWALWGCACFHVAIYTQMYWLRDVYWEVHFWMYDFIRSFARTDPENDLYSSILHAYNFFIFNVTNWLLSLFFVAILSAKTGSRKLWFMFYWAGFNLLPLAIHVDSMIYEYSVSAKELPVVLRAWYTSMASMFIVLPVFIYLGFKAGEKLRKRIMGSSSKGEGITSIPA